jgi:lysophospholipase L1-like esterase
MKTILLLLPFLMFVACKKEIEPDMGNVDPADTTKGTSPANGALKTYLALGDSYTIGETVTLQETFSYQLSASLKVSGLNVGVPRIIAKTGWTTAELQAEIDKQDIPKTYDLVTLLIGVNNQYRGYSQSEYRTEFKKLLQLSIGYAKGDKNHVVVVSIPDWGVTPFGKGSGKDIKKIAVEIDQFNAINKAEAEAAQVKYTDVTALSRTANTDLSLIASDGLHYSGKMYGQWAAAIYPVTVAALK